MGLKRTVAPAALPVTLAELKAHLRISWDSEDTALGIYLAAAIERVEQLTWRALINQTWQLTLPSFPLWSSRDSKRIFLPMPRLVSVTSIEYLDPRGDEQELEAESYWLSTSSEPGAIVAANGFWPATLDGYPEAVTITFVAGFGSAASNVPNELRAAILLAAADLFEHREATKQLSGTVIDCVEALCSPHRVRDDRIADTMAAALLLE